MLTIIRLIGDVDNEMFKHLCTELYKAEQSNTTHLRIELCSPGGSPDIGMAIAAKLRRASKFGIKTYGIVYGIAGSAATAIIAGCDKRYMTKEATMFFHETHIEDSSGTSTTLKVSNRLLRRQEIAWSNFLANRSKTSAKIWRFIHKETHSLNAKECKATGLIHKVV
jgi:ATP-dependent protease ClpP protease subunit